MTTIIIAETIILRAIGLFKIIFNIFICNQPGGKHAPPAPSIGSVALKNSLDSNDRSTLN